MSRFSFYVYINDKHIHSFKSLNSICDFFCRNADEEQWPWERQKKMIDALSIPPFTRRVPQVYVDDSLGMKLEVISRCIEYTAPGYKAPGYRYCRLRKSF